MRLFQPSSPACHSAVGMYFTRPRAGKISKPPPQEMGGRRKTRSTIADHPRLKFPPSSEIRRWSTAELGENMTRVDCLRARLGPHRAMVWRYFRRCALRDDPGRGSIRLTTSRSTRRSATGEDAKMVIRRVLARLHRSKHDPDGILLATRPESILPMSCRRRAGGAEGRLAPVVARVGGAAKRSGRWRLRAGRKPETTIVTRSGSGQSWRLSPRGRVRARQTFHAGPATCRPRRWKKNGSGK